MEFGRTREMPPPMAPNEWSDLTRAETAEYIAQQGDSLKGPLLKALNECIRAKAGDPMEFFVDYFTNLDAEPWQSEPKLSDMPLSAHGFDGTALTEEVRRVLASEQWASFGSMKPGAYAGKAKMIAEAGAPPMVLLPATQLQRLKRIPRSHEAKALVVDIGSLNEKKDRIFLFSHRWLQPREGKPDDAQHTKAHALAEFATWFCDFYHVGRDAYFWVDFCCVDQDSPAAGITALPLYVAACGGVAIFETPDYENRAWCRVERLLACKYQEAGGAPYVINETFAIDRSRLEEGKEYTKEELKVMAKQIVRLNKERRLVTNPMEGHLTVEADRALVRTLCETAQSVSVHHFERREEHNLVFDISDCEARVMF